MLIFLAIAGQALDVTTTWLAISAGFVEVNPLLGPDPNLWIVLLAKMSIIVAVCLLLKNGARLRVLTVCALLGIGAAGWNLHFLA